MSRSSYPRWDIERLVEGQGWSGALELFGYALGRATVFKNRYENGVGRLSPVELGDAMEMLGEIWDLVLRATGYAGLQAEEVPDDGAAMLRDAHELRGRVEQAVRFFEQEWQRVPDERARELLASPALDRYRHHLLSCRLPAWARAGEAVAALVAAVERVVELGVYQRLWARLEAAIEVTVPEPEWSGSLGQALERLHEPDREVRRRVAEAIGRALDPGVEVQSWIVDVFVFDLGLRNATWGLPHWLAMTNMENELDDDIVRELVGAVVAHYALPPRWYRLKASQLGLEEIAHWDRFAPVAPSDRRVTFEEAVAVMLDALSAFSPALAEAARSFFTGPYIEVVPGTRGGARCHDMTPTEHPYLRVSWTGSVVDVLTLAHAIGRGAHLRLAADQGVFQFTPLRLMAETASVLCETLVLEHMLQRTIDPGERLVLLGAWLDGTVEAVFGQIALHRFEDQVHVTAQPETLTVARLTDLWIAAQREWLGESVDLGGYEHRWATSSEIIYAPGHAYDTAFGVLLGLALYEHCRREGADSVVSVLELLRAGSSRSIEELARIAGCDLRASDFWNGGLAVIGRLLDQAEAAATEVNETP